VRAAHGRLRALADARTHLRSLAPDPAGSGAGGLRRCVSSFNHGARRLYERLGYHVVGELTDYIVEGYSEILLRKTRGPLTERPELR
jgi:ribosomal protein S18 acetylase RimI-like enzyme